MPVCRCAVSQMKHTTGFNTGYVGRRVIELHGIIKFKFREGPHAQVPLLNHHMKLYPAIIRDQMVSANCVLSDRSTHCITRKRAQPSSCRFSWKKNNINDETILYFESARWICESFVVSLYHAWLRHIMISNCEQINASVNSL